MAPYQTYSPKIKQIVLYLHENKDDTTGLCLHNCNDIFTNLNICKQTFNSGMMFLKIKDVIGQSGCYYLIGDHEKDSKDSKEHLQGILDKARADRLASATPSSEQQQQQAL